MWNMSAEIVTGRCRFGSAMVVSEWKRGEIEFLTHPTFLGKVVPSNGRLVAVESEIARPMKAERIQRINA